MKPKMHAEWKSFVPASWGAGIKGAAQHAACHCRWPTDVAEEEWGFLLVDATKNAFNEINRMQMCWTIRHEWPSGARFTFNCYWCWPVIFLVWAGKGRTLLFTVKKRHNIGRPSSNGCCLWKAYGDYFSYHTCWKKLDNSIQNWDRCIALCCALHSQWDRTLGKRVLWCPLHVLRRGSTQASSLLWWVRVILHLPFSMPLSAERVI